MPAFPYADLRPDYRGDIRSRGRLQELRYAVEPIPVGESKRLHAHLRGCPDELLGHRDPEPVGEAAPRVQVREALAKIAHVSPPPPPGPTHPSAPGRARPRRRLLAGRGR